jgi:bacterial/archaeal transporter family-2 protein
MIYGLILAAIIVGSLMPIQAGVNAQLTRMVGHPFLGAFISFSIGTIAVSAILLINGISLNDFKKLTTVPPFFFIGGVLGALFVGSSIFLIPKLGATAMIGAFITGQLLMSVLIDHYGLLGAPVSPISVQRLCGVCLLFIGLALVLRKSA